MLYNISRRRRLPWQSFRKRSQARIKIRWFELLDEERRRLATPSQLENFPVPPELREMIYSLVLCVEYDGFEQEDSPGEHLYAMAPQLFLINRAIRAEALGYLYRKHHFLVLDYEMEGLRYMLDDYRVPRVAHREPKLFRYYALHLSLRAESRFAGGKLDPIRGCMCGADVMLMQDLPRLVEVLRLSGHKTRARYVYVDTEREKPVEPKFPKALYGVVDKMSLELTKGREECAHLSYPEMDQAMRTLETIIGGNLEMSWTGFQGCTVQMPRAQLVSPKLVWLRALEWDRLQLLLQFKARADNLATSPSRAKQMAAATMYQHLLHDHDSKLSCIPTSSLDAELLRVRSWLANLGIDLMASCTQMWLRFGQPEGYQGYLRQLPVPLEGATETTALIANLHLESAVEEYLGCYSGRSVKEAKRRVRDWVWLVEGMVENWREEEVGRCRGVLEANLGVGREVLFLTGAPFIGPDLFLSRLATRALPFQTADSLAPDLQKRKPAGLSGWQDEQHLTALSCADTRLIMQKGAVNDVTPQGFVVELPPEEEI